jgi:hypothetical protein
MLTFKVASFDINNNCILRRPFPLISMVVIHTAYAIMKVPGLKGVITINADQLDALACENALLLHVGRFSDKAAQDQEAKMQGGSTPWKTSASKPLTSSTPRASVGTTSQKGINTASTSTQLPIDRKADNKMKGASQDEGSK